MPFYERIIPTVYLRQLVSLQSWYHCLGGIFLFFAIIIATVSPNIFW